MESKILTVQWRIIVTGPPSTMACLAPHVWPDYDAAVAAVKKALADSGAVCGMTYGLRFQMGDDTWIESKSSSTVT
jgi:hypothetical protein